jgi:drug/metabolite transporter (DMT)-like permease
MPRSSPSSFPLRIAIALIAVYLIWGSTYLGVRIALHDVPPLLLVGVRYCSAGLILYAWLRMRGAPRPSRAHWLSTGMIGTLLMGGSAATAYALRDLPTGVTAIACGSVPLWSLVFTRVRGERSTAREWIGLLLGLFGVVLLNAKSELRAHATAAIVLLVGSLAWSYGSVMGRHASLPSGGMASALQMMLGGLLVMVIALISGDRISAMPSATTFIAFAYLVLIGSIVGYSAYVYLLPRVRPALATSYAYVNPIVAVGLAIAFEGERLSGPTLLASLLILGGVAIVGLGAGLRGAAAPRATEPRAELCEGPVASD